jgi:hypothetical protein
MSKCVWAAVRLPPTILSSIHSLNIVAESPGVCVSTVMVSSKLASPAFKKPTT